MYICRITIIYEQILPILFGWVAGHLCSMVPNYYFIPHGLAVQVRRLVTDGR